MNKINSKGFFLAETLVVVSVVAVTLTILFGQISNIFLNYSNKINKYNTTNAIYAAYNIKKCFQSENLLNLISTLNSSGNNYIEIDLQELSIDTFSASILNTNNIDFYQFLINELNISKIYFTTYDPSDLGSSNIVTNDLRKYINSIDISGNAEDYIYRVIIVLADGSYGNLIINTMYQI